MKYSKEEVIQYVREEDVKFIRIAFCDVFGKKKNISIVPEELPRAFEYGIAFDASAISGFGDETHSDLFLHPEAETLMPLPWRPEHGKVVRMFARVSYPDGTPFECDTRGFLKKAMRDAEKAGFSFSFGSEQEFYLFNLDENGKPTKEPHDEAGYMDIAPDDRGENIRREICLTLEQMGIHPESSHHEEGAGQNEIDFRYSDALTAADNSLTFQNIVKTIAYHNGLFADFSAKPLENSPGNGFHINISVKPCGKSHNFEEEQNRIPKDFYSEEEQSSNSKNLYYMIAGILEKVEEMTVFLNPTENSYKRFGNHKAPGYISWSSENRSQLVRIPAAIGEYRRAELRSPDPAANPYLAFGLIIYAGLYGLENKLNLPKEANFNLYKADSQALSEFKKLPKDLDAARRIASASDFIRKHVPAQILDIYCNK